MLLIVVLNKWGGVMKNISKFFVAGISCIALLTACSKDDANKLDPNKIYFFYQSTCPHCHHALEYINRSAPDVSLEMVSIDGPGRDLFLQCVEKFDLPRNAIGTPLICMGDNYLMGWSPEYEIKFDEYIAPYRIKAAEKE